MKGSTPRLSCQVWLISLNITIFNAIHFPVYHFIFLLWLSKILSSSIYLLMSIYSGGQCSCRYECALISEICWLGAHMHTHYSCGCAHISGICWLWSPSYACVSSLQLGDNGQTQVLESPPGQLLCSESFDPSMEGYWVRMIYMPISTGILSLARLTSCVLCQ